MKSIYTFLTISFFLASCGGGGEDNSLAGKKQKLTTLQAEVKKLQAEIAKLEPKKEETKIKNVTVSPVVAQSFKHFVDVQGTLEAENNQYISPQMGGAITALLVKEGDFVKKGQTIARVENSVLKTSLQEIEVQLETAKTLFEKQKALWDQKIGTEVQYIQAKTGVEALEKRLLTLNEQIKMAVVTSPISGFVDEVRQRAGEMAMPGMGIVRVVNFDNLKVKANVADVYAGTIKKGDLVKITFPDLGKEINARLSFVNLTVNPISRTFVAEALIPNIDKQLKPNMLAIVNINDQAKANAIVVPQNLVQRTEQGDVIYVAVAEGNQKIARGRIVKTGLNYNGQVEIVSGLQSGDLLITQGYQEIVDGQVIAY
jgi:membrane fusion protein, multidrug efflux system